MSEKIKTQTKPEEAKGSRENPWTANLTNSKESPWLDLFVEGWYPKPRGGEVKYKTAEGRLNKEKWSEMQIGEYLLMKDKEPESEKWALFRITARYEARDFQELAKEHRWKLAPHLSSVEEVVAAYQEIVDSIQDGQKIMESVGVVAIEVKLLEHHGFGW